MALRFLPAEYIPAQFEVMDAAEPSPTIGHLQAYYRKQWLENSVSPVASSSVFNREIRTNNDVKGWHHRFHIMATNQSSFNMYKMINLLHVEAQNVNIQVLVLSNGALLQHKWKKYKKVQTVITECWQQLTEGNMSAKEVLKRCARVNGPI